LVRDLRADLGHYVGSPLDALVEINFVLTSSVVVRRAALEALGGFREDAYAEDPGVDPARGAGRPWPRRARWCAISAARRPDPPARGACSAARRCSSA
jgi:hypothetical protein